MFENFSDEYDKDQKEYSVKQMAEILDVTENCIYDYVSKLKLKLTTHEDNNRKKYFSYTQMKLLYDYVYGLRAKKLKQKSSQKYSDTNLEELRKLHPLVKDDRFFKEDYFPDITL